MQEGDPAVPMATTPPSLQEGETLEYPQAKQRDVLEDKETPEFLDPDPENSFPGEPTSVLRR